MKTPSTLTLRSFLLQDMCPVFMALIVGISSSHGEQLTGIVKQPVPPYQPAPDSVVTVFESDGRTRIAGPDTTDETGRYKYEVAKGKKVIVEASWKPKLSTPGKTEATMLTNPTEADVQLLPPKTAAEESWLQAGRETGKMSGDAALLALSTLQGADVPAASIFQFVRGAQGVAAPFKGLAGVEIFDSKNPQIVVQALREAEKQFQTTGSVPTYQELAPKLEGPLTKEQHLEILGFIAPKRDSAAWGHWETAVGKSVGPSLKTAVLLKEANFDETLFQVTKQSPR